ncbi:RagB/SusD family nutrient uptake outer membrane protein [Terrimonas sp.]|uniref:RagB/SusD family nutrient uptake outer membrane protein n=1 Tax=Terrimonas sp. TaxID=1914338 RepID=UPI000D51AD83|nr:RagB/SusD family nutrient uptake outer membrane protein [Terrimonas sp.]PVD50000.1 RagB/SusD family nutrient uptake outer membrane protein [Terrimonas sp.]
MRHNYKTDKGFRSLVGNISNRIDMWINVSKIFLILFAGITTLNISCKKLVEIPAPEGTITTPQVFETEAVATAAMAGVYHTMINANGTNLSNGAITIWAGTSADEFRFFLTNNSANNEFLNNNLSSSNAKLQGAFWQNGFSIIYGANSIIEGLNTSTGIRDSVKSELIAEAKFVRAFCNFYLTNLFGDIPIVNDINWRVTKTLSRSGTTDVYHQIITDLMDAYNILPENFSVGKGQRIIPNKYAAAALLARVYLYTGDWEKAEQAANDIISNSTMYTLENNLDDVFKINSSETIWQLQQSNTTFPYYATAEGYQVIPYDATSQPFIYLREELLNAFEETDKRKQQWVDSTVYANTTYYYPKKYRIGEAQQSSIGEYVEYYMVFRLAEQFLIRAEAKAQQDKLIEAVNDINMIRERAGLHSLPPDQNKAQILEAIEQERKAEFFAEWGHRWLDLKRWNKADMELGPIKGNNWQSSDQLYPIPVADLLTNPNLTQNQGY